VLRPFKTRAHVKLTTTQYKNAEDQNSQYQHCKSKLHPIISH